ncbi:MAG: N-formylglutamate amidohydrolase [Pseudomonadota bacterium]
MEETAPFRLLEPASLTSAAIFNSPHSGASYPKAMLERSRLTAHQLRASEDAFVDQLFASAPEFGAPLLAATAPRAWLDLNRGPNELDPALIDGVQTSGLNQRIAAGLGVLPRIVAEGVPIYDGKLSIEEAQSRITDVHQPYHDMLGTLVRRGSQRFGKAVLFDCHSMPTDALRAAPKVRGSMPEIVLGDRFGAAAAREITAETQSLFQQAGFSVARNAPFAGGYITQRYGRPSRNIHAVQIEIDRGLYMDQTRLEPLPEFEDIQSRIRTVVQGLTMLLSDGLAVAAE